MSVEIAGPGLVPFNKNESGIAGQIELGDGPLGPCRWKAGVGSMAHHEAHHVPLEHEHPDQWHRHTAEEGTPMAEHGAIASPGALLRAWVVICLTVAGVVTVLAVYFESYNTQMKRESIETTVLSKGFNEYKGLNEKDTTTYGWADANAGTVRIPFDKAAERTIEKYKKAGK